MIQLTPENFQSEVVRSIIPTAVDFWASWCAPCKKFAPIYEELSHEYEGRVKFCKVDAEQYSALAAECGVANIPTVIIYRDGKEVRRVVGAKSADEFEDILDRLI